MHAVYRTNIHDTILHISIVIHHTIIVALEEKNIFLHRNATHLGGSLTIWVNETDILGTEHSILPFEGV